MYDEHLLPRLRPKEVREGANKSPALLQGRGAAIAATENGSQLSFGVYDYMSCLIQSGKKSASCCISE